MYRHTINPLPDHVSPMHIVTNGNRGLGYYYCTTCLTTLTDNDYTSHCQSKPRTEAVEKKNLQAKCANEMIRRMALIKAMQNGIDSLGSKPWKYEVESLLYNCMITDHTPQDVKTANDLHTKAQVLLSKKLDMERLSLLELAVWKYCCRKSRTEPVGYLDWKLWHDGGWKTATSACRPSSDIHVILTCVTRFAIAKRHAK
jgi:hypothetical protein